MTENKYLTIEIQRSNILYCDILHYSFFSFFTWHVKNTNQLVFTFKEHFLVRFVHLFFFNNLRMINMLIFLCFLINKTHFNSKFENVNQHCLQLLFYMWYIKFVLLVLDMHGTNCCWVGTVHCPKKNLRLDFYKDIRIILGTMFALCWPTVIVSVWT